MEGKTAGLIYELKMTQVIFSLYENKQEVKAM